jgi:hypothetical protein
MMRASRPALAGLLLLVMGSACDQKEIATCDITQRACQESIYYRMLNLRGDGYDPFGGLPPVTVITEDEYRAILLADQAAAPPSPEEKADDKALELLHFTPPATPPPGDGGVDGGAGNQDAGNSSIDDQVAHIYAFYDQDTKTVTVISHPNQTGSQPVLTGMYVLAHELVHALQDRELDLKRTHFSSSDDYLAYKGMVEGDARFYEYLFDNDLRVMQGLAPADALQWPDDELEYAYAHFDELGSPLFAAQYLMYPFGAKYEATAYRSGGNAAVRHAYAKEPQHTVGFMVGPDGRVPPVSSGAVSEPPVVCSLLTTKGAIKERDQMGAVPIYTFLRAWGVDHAASFATAQTWTGDYLFVQANADLSTTAVAWRLEFSAAVPAAIALVLTASGELSVRTGAKSIEITTTDSTTPLVWIPSANCP